MLMLFLKFFTILIENTMRNIKLWYNNRKDKSTIYTELIVLIKIKLWIIGENKKKNQLDFLLNDLYNLN